METVRKLVFIVFFLFQTGCSLNFLVAPFGPAKGVSFEETQISVSENSDRVQFKIQLAEPAPADVTVPFQVSGSATNTEDYTTTYEAHFEPGSLEAIVEIQILQDLLDEPDEDISVRLLELDEVELGSNSTMTIIIEDDDAPPTLSLVAPTLDELSGSYTLTLNLDQESAKEITFDWSVANDQAVVTEDIQPASGSITLAPGQTSAEITVDLIDDSYDENDESFLIDITNEAHVTIPPSGLSAAIIDEDPEPTISIDSPSVMEGDDVVFTISLSGLSQKSISFDYGSSDGTATSTTDYTADSGTITIDPMTASTTVTISSIEDADVCETVEDLSVSLSNLSNAQAGTTAGTGSITDDDYPNITITNSQIKEGEVAKFNVELDQTCNVPTSFEWNLVPGSATESEDYVSTTGSVLINAGETTSSINVETVADSLVETKETFYLAYKNITNGVKSGAGMAQATIQDDDSGYQVLKVSSGEAHSCALISDGSVKCWGSDKYGQLGLGGPSIGDHADETGANLKEISWGTGRTVTQFTQSLQHTCALLDDGSVKCAGDGGYGKLGTGDIATRGASLNDMGDNLPSIYFGSGLTPSKIVSGYGHSCSLFSDGRIKCWGIGNFGGLGIGDTEHMANESNELGAALPFVDLGTGRTAIDLALGQYFTCAILDNNKVKCWGHGNNGRLGSGNTNNLGDEPGEMGDNLPYVDLGTGVLATEIDVSTNSACVRTTDNRVKCWGANGSGQLGYGDTNSRGDTPGEMGDNLPFVDLGTGRTAQQIALGENFTCALLDDNTVKCWGYNSDGRLGQESIPVLGNQANEMGDFLPAIDLGTGLNPIQIQAYLDHACALFDNNSVKCWGYNRWGQLGYGHTNSLGDEVGEMGDALPAIDFGGRTPVALSGNGGEGSTTCVKFASGQLSCFGRNNYHQLGVNSYMGDDPGEMGANLPTVDLGTGLKAIDIQVKRNSSCALLSNNSLKCWGQNTYGQLGQEQGTTIGDEPGQMGDNLPSINVGTGRKVIDFAMTGNSTCAIRDDQQIVCWGVHSNGVLGYPASSYVGNSAGEMGDSLQIVDLGTGRTPIDLVAGSGHFCALLDNQSIKCWGNNSNGRLGIESSQHKGDQAGEMGDNLPAVNLGTGVTAKAIYAGGGANCAITMDNRLKCWGYGSYGTLLNGSGGYVGDAVGEMGDNLDYSLLGTGRTVVDLDIGTNFVCAALDNSQTKCWGLGDVGQLGLGSTTNWGSSINKSGDHLQPVELGTGLASTSFGLGDQHACSLLDDNSVKCWGKNDQGQLGYEHSTALGDNPNEMGANLLTVDILGGASGPGVFVVKGVTGGSDSTADAWLGHNEATIEWTVSTGVADYQVEILANDGTTSICAPQVTASTAYSFIGCTLTDNTSYIAKVIARDGIGGELEATNAPFVFHVDQTPPGAFTITGVTGGQDSTADNSLDDGQLPQANWTTSLAATFFDIEIFEADGITTKCAQQSVAGGQLSSYFAGCALTNGNTYEVKVEARDQVGNTTTASNSQFSFTVAESVAPLSFAIQGVTGGNDSTIDNILANGSWPTAHWQAVDGADSVSVEILDTDGTTTLCGPSATDPSDTQFEFTNCSLSVGNTYFVKVEATDSVSTVAASNSPYSFTVDASAGPATFEILGIQGGSDTTNDSILADGNYAHIYWAPAANTDHYEITIYEPGSTNTRCAMQTTSSTDYNFSTCHLESGRSYEARVIAYDASSNATAAYNNPFSFTLPTKPLLTIDNVSTAEGGTLSFTVSLPSVATENVTFSWIAHPNSALGGADFINANGSETILTGQQTATINITTVDDLVSEVDETLFVAISQPTKAEVGENRIGIGTITDNDAGTMISKVTVGRTHACSLASHGEVKCWGNKTVGSIGQESSVGQSPNHMGDNLKAAPLSVVGPPKQLSQGINHTCALLADDSVRCWGYNAYGQLGIGSTDQIGGKDGDISTLTAVNLGSGLTPTKITSGYYHNCAIFTSGQVKCWGRNQYGQLGIGDTTSRGVSLALMGDNLPYVDLGTGRTALDITAYDLHTCALLDNNQIKCWGRGSSGRLGYENTDDLGDNANEMGDNLPYVNLGTGRTATKVAAGSAHTCAIRDDNSLVCWGEGQNYRLGTNTTDDIGNDPDEMGDFLSAVNHGGGTPTDISLSVASTCVLFSDGSIKCFGDNSEGQGGQGAINSSLRADSVPAIDLGAPATQLFMGGNHACALLNTGDLKCWGDNTYGQLGLGHKQHIGDSYEEMGSFLPAVNLGTGLQVSQLASVGNGNHTCSILNDDSIKCWGRNSYYQLGNEDFFAGDNVLDMGANLPAIDLGAGRTAKDLYSAYDRNCALLDDDTVKCWGYNAHGQAGQEHTDHIADDSEEMGDNLPAIEFQPGRTPLKVAIDRYHSCAILDDFSLTCWGANGYGRTGLEVDAGNTGATNGEMGAALPFVNLGLNRKAVSISVAMNHTCALLDTGEVKCFGANSGGVLGQGHTNYIGDEPQEMGEYLRPVNLGSGLKAVQIDTMEQHVCAVLTNQKLKCWGNGAAGALGLGNTSYYGDEANEMGDNLPFVDLGTGLSPQAIAVGDNTACATLNTGDTKCWGNNTYGALGLEDTSSRGDGADMGDLLPTVNFGTGRTPHQISMGQYSACAVLDNGQIKCWGRNFNSALGLGDLLDRGDESGEMGDNLPNVNLGY